MRRNGFKDIKLVLFDLDNTLFDHRNSLLKGILAARSHLGIYSHNIEDLASKYNRSLEQAYQKYLNGELSYEEKDRLKIIYYFQSLRMAEPTNAQIQDFVGVYESAYMANRRATFGSIHTLKELRKRGYRLGILTNGQIEDQTIKSRDIGVADLVDSILTSEELGHRKPSQEMFSRALELFGREPNETIMVGDSKKDDVMGSLEAGITPVLYDPNSQTTILNIGDKQILVIQEMRMLLSYL